MIIDIHGHLGNINFAPFWQADAARLEQYAAAAGVDRLCVSSARSIMYDVREGNRELAEALARSERLLGYVTVNPLFPDSLEDLRYLEQPKFIGVKVHADYHGYDLRSRLAQEFLGPVADRTPLMLFHVSCMPGTGFADTEAVLQFAAAHPRTKIVMAHMAGIFQNGNYPYFPNFRGLELVNRYACANVYVDTAHYLMYVYPGVMERMVELVGADHIVFGTDCPLQGPAQMRFALEIIAQLQLADDERNKITAGNALALIQRQ
jgi:predicted TIM-barrel fold metal-dependent hydrolase